MSITTVGNQLIHYEVLGRGEPLIFIHGWLGSWRYWWPSMQAMSAAQHRAFAFDLWGYGDSSKAEHLYSMDSYVEMLKLFIDQLGIATPVTLVGHSLGAAVAVRYANENPDDVGKIAAVSLPLQGEYIHNRLLNTDPVTFLNKVVGKSNSFNEVDSEIGKADPVAVQRLAEELNRRDVLMDLELCECPVLMVFGGQDTVVRPPEDDLPGLEGAENNRYLVALDNCHHFPMLQEKAKFNRLLLDFIHASSSMTQLTVKEYWQRRTR
ncbi:MAG: alpha/beta hydrolase [Chloroflexi bacterium]|nr:MAG: alpha/beta hydrolase [Chloroflexota bacterium]